MLDKKEERILRAMLDGRIEDADTALRALERLQYQINDQVARAKRELEKAKEEKSKALAAFGLEE